MNIKKYAHYFWMIPVLISAIVFSYLNYWKIFEQDLFYLTRYGEEILQNYTVQTYDRWTHTIYGQEARHFQWFTSVIFALWAKVMGGMDLFPLLRSLLTGSIFLIWGKTISLNLKKDSYSFIHLFLILPWLYLMNWLRFQLRPDLFGILLFSLLVLMMSQNFTKKRLYLSLFIFSLWVQFHSGTAIVGLIMLSMAVMASTEEWCHTIKQKFYWLLAVGILWIANPQHFHIIRILFETTQVSLNPDLQPFSLKLLSFEDGGFSYLLFSVYWLITLLYLIMKTETFHEFSGIYRKKIFTFTLMTIYSILFFKYIRTIVYLTVFMIPLASYVINYYFDQIPRRWSQIKWLFYMGIIAVVWFKMIPVQKSLNVEIGSGTSALWMPVKSAEFIRAQRPSKQLYNHFNFGGYLTYVLREYPVFYDGRETPFNELTKERQMAAQKPETYDKFLRKYDVNTVLETLPTPDVIKKYQEFYPSNEWARVFTDLCSTVYLRRVPENYPIISKFESTGSIPSSGTRPAVNLSQDEIQKLIREANEEIRRRNQK